MKLPTLGIGDLLRADHEYLRFLFSQLSYIEDEDLGRLFCDIHHALLHHDRAEELVFYPAIRKWVPDGDNIARAYLYEGEETQHLIGELDRRRTKSKAMTLCISELREQILTHAHHEEVDPLVLLEENLSARELVKLGLQYKILLHKCPGRPMI